MAGGLKMWSLLEAVNHDDLNTNFNLLLLRVIAIEQEIAAGVVTGGGTTSTPLVFSDGEVALFSDGSNITLSA